MNLDYLFTGQVFITNITSPFCFHLHFYLKIKELVEKGGDVTHQEETDGTSALMLVAAHGNVEMIEFLLSEGAVWNAVDRKHKCAGDYATDAGHQV